MAVYIVKCRGTVEETYAVEADSPGEAYENWYDGEILNSEADTSAYSVELST